MARRKVCVVTGTRAEYGLLYWLMKELESDSGFELQIVATGTHLSPEFGLTYKTIEDDGFKIAAKVEALLSSDSPAGVAKSTALAVTGFADAFQWLKPDIVLLIGDRYETLGAAQAALIAGIPIAHIHGGEVTRGSIDESMRHAITKMSHIHFTTADAHQRRVRQLGENPKYVYNVGAPGLENIAKLKPMSKTEFEKFAGFSLGKTNFLVTYHPETAGNSNPVHSLRALFAALDRFPEARLIFTKSNADAGGREINKLIEHYVSENGNRAVLVTSLGMRGYLTAVSLCDTVIGNSSSGIIEVPFLKKPTVNIGDRQTGRPKAESVIDCPENADAVAAAIEKSLSKEFRALLPQTVSPYGTGETSRKMKDILAQVDLSGLTRKDFFDYEIG